jgi:hypothetical protein
MVTLWYDFDVETCLPKRVPRRRVRRLLLAEVLLLVGLLRACVARPAVITGIAIYPYWETSADEWAVYASTWLGR